MIAGSKGLCLVPFEVLIANQLFRERTMSQPLIRGADACLSAAEIEFRPSIALTDVSSELTRLIYRIPSTSATSAVRKYTRRPSLKRVALILLTHSPEDRSVMRKPSGERSRELPVGNTEQRSVLLCQSLLRWRRHGFRVPFCPFISLLRMHFHLQERFGMISIIVQCTFQ